MTLYSVVQGLPRHCAPALESDALHGDGAPQWQMKPFFSGRLRPLPRLGYAPVSRPLLLAMTGLLGLSKRHSGQTTVFHAGRQEPLNLALS